MKTILITGDRNFKDKNIIESTILEISKDFSPDDYTVIHGGCRGADNLSSIYFNKLNYKILEIKADWIKYGKKAGPI